MENQISLNYYLICFMNDKRFKKQYTTKSVRKGSKRWVAFGVINNALFPCHTKAVRWMSRHHWSLLDKGTDSSVLFALSKISFIVTGQFFFVSLANGFRFRWKRCIIHKQIFIGFLTAFDLTSSFWFSFLKSKPN